MKAQTISSRPNREDAQKLQGNGAAETLEPGTIERAIEIALQAHAGQKLPTGEPYILHPLRMLTKMKSPQGQIVALLHDVVEKSSGWNLHRLRREGFSREIVEAVKALTKRKGESFSHSVERAGYNRIGREVKRADIADRLRYFPSETNIAEYSEALLALIARRDPDPIGVFEPYGTTPVAHSMRPH
jgi:(p)ppGpp synthase/HD superfamily hydrolase